MNRGNSDSNVYFQMIRIEIVYSPSNFPKFRAVFLFDNALLRQVVRELRCDISREISVWVYSNNNFLLLLFKYTNGPNSLVDFELLRVLIYSF